MRRQRGADVAGPDTMEDRSIVGTEDFAVGISSADPVDLYGEPEDETTRAAEEAEVQAQDEDDSEPAEPNGLQLQAGKLLAAAAPLRRRIFTKERLNRMLAPFTPDECELTDSGDLSIKRSAIERRLDAVLGAAGWEWRISASGAAVVGSLVVLGKTRDGLTPLTGGTPQLWAASERRAFRAAAERFGVGRFLRYLHPLEEGESYDSERLLEAAVAAGYNPEEDPELAEQ